ncbi:DUF4124 domain-containing protein [Wenzhouxiangella sp. XN24]|uniref:DUF4124 domain-containing protein n=1 Tax=Wenzhouxiangella sp. XN24 TaxID=2713569 RepID=UPI0013EA5E7B|nr:DUF4124 domain-containing protein [Wenzhouxiangella sp. XN24]NGX17605.1 DUF4124 domain-containing protein [Wenzhouxiangella sp. XN24]
MRTRDVFLSATAAILLVAASGTADAQKVYRWVDENGVVHFGDAIPPEYSREKHEVLDGRGTRVTVHGEKDEDTGPVYSSRDLALLTTYASVADIEAVRDNRLGYLHSQNDVALERLQNLQQRRTELAGNPAAINELATVEQRIGEYDAELERRNAEIERIRAQFEDDILRFRELKSITTAEGPTPPEGLDPER